jgi:hypothetical protein
MRNNRLYGSEFINGVKQCEMEGHELLYIKKDEEKKNIKLFRFATEYGGGRNFEVKYYDKNNPHDIKDIIIKDKNGDKKSLGEKFVYVLTGGDGSNRNEPTTRVGLVLHEIESYDRAKNAMRKNNHLFGKVTPVFSSENAQDVKDFTTKAQNKSWKIGDVIAALKGELKMVVPEVGAMENLKAEQVTCAKAISATTGIPIHWLGYVDLMSNRATAETLYETINNATILDRSIWEESIYILLVKAQTMAIDAGYLPTAINYDFEVKIPLLSFGKMFELIKALSLAYSDEAISIQDYRNQLPNIDPYKTAKFIEEDKEDVLTGLKNDLRSIDDGEKDDDPDSKDDKGNKNNPQKNGKKNN